MSLLLELRQVIESEGGVGVDSYMRMALMHPLYGYYQKQQPFGAKGDFTTAPEISQMFGELLGIWVVDQWHKLGKPERWELIECGPGRGTLMQDVLRTIGSFAKQMPKLAEKMTLQMVEASVTLKTQQEKALEKCTLKPEVRWRAELEAPDTPFILLANEFLDALPIEQFVWVDGRWHERLVILKKGELAFGLGEAVAYPYLPDGAKEGDIFEHCPDAHRFIDRLSVRLAAQHGCALFIDYGHSDMGWGDTLQAVKDHKPWPVLYEPGSADITAHVDFGRLAGTARMAGCDSYGAVSQRRFLSNLGIHTRAQQLCQTAMPPQQQQILSALHRLTGPDQMGTLFRVLCLQSPHLPAPAGFE